MKSSDIKHLLLLLLAALFMVACGGDDDSSSGGKVAADNQNMNLQLNAQGWEVPHLSADTKENLFINHTLSGGLPNYCMEYVFKKYHTRWVAYKYDATSSQQNVKQRDDAWAADPALNKYPTYQIAMQFFPGGYARGHLCGAAERYYSLEAHHQTFYMSNMSPMLSSFNSDWWPCIEDRCRDDWGRPCKNNGSTLYVVKGSTLDNVKTTISLRNTTGNEVSVPVPKYYYMACVCVTKKGNVTGIGFLMEHKDYTLDYNKEMQSTGISKDAYLKKLARNSAMSIDDLEAKIGIDLFCNIPDALENNIEARHSISDWAGL